MRDVTIGPCRMLLGDARELLRDLEDCADLVVTDPPYLLTSGGRNSQVMGGKFSRARYDNSGSLMRTIRWDEMAGPIFRACKPRADCYVMANDKQVFAAHAAFSAEGWRFHNLLTWNKRKATRNRWYMKNQEYTLYLYRGRARTINMPGSLQQFTCLADPIDWHPTAKPVSLFQHYIENSSMPGDVVLDPFCGSGTCAIAAMRSGRRSISIEVDEEWFERKLERVAMELQSLQPGRRVS